MSGVSHSFSTALPIPWIILARLHAGVRQVPLALEEHLQSDVIAKAANERSFARHTNHFAGMLIEVHVDNPSGRIQQNGNDQCNVALTQDQTSLCSSRCVEE